MSSSCVRWRWVVVFLLHIQWYLIWSQTFSINITLIALSPSNSSTHNQTQRAFAWTEIEKGVITASYFYGNGAVMIVASVFINKFNTKHVFRWQTFSFLMIRLLIDTGQKYKKLVILLFLCLALVNTWTCFMHINLDEIHWFVSKIQRDFVNIFITNDLHSDCCGSFI